MNKFKVGDLVTVVVGKPVWYTYLDECRKEKLGRTGTVVEVEKQTFTKEDLLWDAHFNANRQRLDAIPNDYLETIYNYRVRFPDEPERHIVFCEIHLKAFEMPEKREFFKKVDDSEVFSKYFSLNHEYREESTSLIKKLHMRCAKLEGQKSTLLKYIDEKIEESIKYRDTYPKSKLHYSIRDEIQERIDLLYKLKTIIIL